MARGSQTPRGLKCYTCYTKYVY